MPQPTTIQAALAAVMADVREVRKTDRNTAQNFSFRGIDAVLNAVGPALRAHGVVIMPRVLDYRYDTVEVGQRRTQMGHVIITAEYTFVGPAGDSLTAVALGEAMDAGDKAVPKAMSVALRTALLQALALPTDDPDPDAQSYERSAREAALEPPAATATSTPGPAFAALMKAMLAAETPEALAAAADAVSRTAASLSPTQKSSLREAYARRAEELKKSTQPEEAPA